MFSPPTVTVYTDTSRPSLSVFGEYIPDGVWDNVNGQIEYIKGSSLSEENDYDGSSYGYGYHKTTISFEYKIVGDSNIYRISCDYEPRLISKWHRKIYIEYFKFTKNNVKQFPILWSHDRSFSSLPYYGVYTDKTDGSLKLVWPSDNYDEFSDDISCSCYECHRPASPEKSYIEFESDEACVPEIIVDRGQDKMFENEDSFAEKITYEETLEFLDKFQRESDKIDFTFAGNSPVQTIDEIISDLPPEKAVQLILSYCPNSVIESGK